MSSKRSPKDNTQSPDKKEDEEQVEALGGISRLMKEYGDGLTLYGWLGAIGAILNGATMPAFFLFFGDLIDIGSGTEPELDLVEEALILMLKFFAVGLGFFIFNSMQYVCWGYYGAKISIAVRKSYFELLLNQEVGYYDAKNSGALNTALISDCLKISGMGSAIGLFLQHFVTFITGFALAFYYSWRLSLALMGVVPLFVVVGVVSAWFEKQGVAGGGSHGGADGNKTKSDPTELAGLFSNEVLISIRSVKAIPILLQSKLEEYAQKLEDIVPFAKKKALGMGLGLGGMFFAFLGAMYSIGYWYGGKLVDNGTIDIGDMYLCMFALPIGAMSLGQLGTANGDISNARNAANKFFRLKDRKPKMKAIESENKITKTETLKGNITFENVSFQYPTAVDTIVLNEVSFSIEEGKTLAIVGPSGSGKSTIISLLERYYDPNGGNILIDGEEIHNYDIDYLRKQIGFVSQTPLLFAESIKENIRGGNPNITDEHIINAAKMADAHGFIMQLTEKYETNVGEMGNRLSGGQKQRIAIARAIVSNPSILLLDEATSALDTKSEREVQKAIDNISSTRSKTIVVIAHRLSTIKNADKILVIVDGEVEEEGNHESLIDSNGVYAALVREQQVTGINDDNNAPPSYDEQHEQKNETGRTATYDKQQQEEENPNRTETVALTIDNKKDDKKEEKEEEKVPDMGGTKRLNSDYAGQFKCLWFSGVVFACLNGILWPISYGWFFPEIITMLSKEIHCETDALSITACHTSFEKASLKLAMYWLAIGTYALIVVVLQTYLFGIYGVRLANIVKLDWFKSMLSQDIAYHDNQTSSKLNANLSIETQSISDGMGWKFGILIQSIVQLIVGFVIAFYRSWRVTLVFLGLTPLLVISGLLQSMIWMGTGTGNADPFLDSGIVSQEILTNIRTVLAFPYLIITKTETFTNKLQEGLPIATKRSAISGFSMGVNLLIAQGIVYGVGMYAGLRFADKGWVTFDDVMGAFFGVLTGGMAIGQAGAVFSAFQAAKLAANKFYVDKERKAEIKKSDIETPIQSQEALKGSIEFKNVSFAYHSNPNTLVLKDISFKVESNSTLAIVGPSGSGKSTIISLIERFYDPINGNIILDDGNENNAIHNYDISYLRSQIGLVSQMPLLFDTSITDNIRGGNHHKTMDNIIEAAKQANAHDFIMKFENKYDTMVGELGNKLSGGQRQRIAIARALLNKPSILLLDEATSALDSKSEKEVQDAIDKISQNGNQTIISIAHRLSTIRNCDMIIVLVDGMIREYGNHQSLMDNNGVYNALVNAQTLVEKTKVTHVRRRSSIVNIVSDIIKEEINTTDQ